MDSFLRICSNIPELENYRLLYLYKWFFYLKHLGNKDLYTSIM